MDAAYDSKTIRQQSIELGHRPIIDPVKRYPKVQSKVQRRKNGRSWKLVIHTEKTPRDLTWAERDRFAERTMGERGASKVMAHRMFGVLALTVDQLLKLSG